MSRSKNMNAFSLRLKTTALVGLLALAVILSGCLEGYSNKFHWIRKPQPTTAIPDVAYPPAIAAILSKPITVTKFRNPILQTKAIPWATHYPENPQILKDGNTYHMYFHAANDSSYRIGHAAARAIAGPWRVDPQPILDVSPGSWDSGYTATAYVMKVGDTYYMWYSGWNPDTGIHTGLATSNSASGPFVKDADNPLSGVALWVGGVQLVNGTYYMLAGSELAQDLYTSSNPKGPWTHVGRPFAHGAPGSWNAAGTMGESGLVYVKGVWYMFMAGLAVPAEPPDATLRRHFKIGMALSLDALIWYEHPNNPIIDLGPTGAYDDSRLSEVQTYYEKGNFYISYTAVRQPANPPDAESLAMSVIQFAPK